MNQDFQITPEVERLFNKIQKICHDLAWNRFDRAEELFELTKSNEYPDNISKLAESFGMMLVKLEAREYRMEQIMAELRQAGKELELSRRQLLKENAGLKKGLMERFSAKRIEGKSPEMLKILDQVERIADTSVNVLISGETGTGKELVAKALHYNSQRRTGPFVAINCSAIPETLFESELFGIEKGVATGVNKHIGLVEQAMGGTLFLDEIADMTIQCQAKILRALEERELTRVGGDKSIPIDIRVVVATNKDLQLEVEAERFRSDLFFRLNVVSVTMPPLRQRTQDIPLLLKRFLRVHCQNMNKSPMKISKEAMLALMEYDWPGNVRELENEVERLVALSYSSLIRKEDLSPHILRKTGHEQAFNQIPKISEKNGLFTSPVSTDVRNPEKQIIIKTLKATNGNKTQAARLLGISREGLRKKIIRLFEPDEI